MAQDSIKLVELESVTVTGTRLTGTSPITNTVITSKEITKDYRGEEVTYILAKTPSVTVSSDGGHEQGYTYFRLRGIDQTRLNFTLNGVPLNEPEDQGVYFSNFPMFAQNIQSVEIQRGVGTTSNGVSSYGGSLNFESKSGYTKGGGIGVNYGSFNTALLHANYSTGILLNRFSMFGSAGLQMYDGYRENSGGRGYSLFFGGQYYGGKTLVKLTAFSGASNNQQAWLAVSEADIKRNPKTNYNTKGDDDNFRQSMIQAQLVRTLNAESTISGTVYYNRLDGDWDLNLATFGDEGKLNYQLSSNFVGGMVNYNVNWDVLRFDIGVNGSHYNRQHSMSVLPDIDTLLYTNNGIRNGVNGFVKVGVKFGKFMVLSDTELRYTTFEYEGSVQLPTSEWVFLNPKGGLVFKQTPDLHYYFYVGASNREPTRTNMFFGNDNIDSLSQYRLVKAETVVDYELGLKYNRSKINVNFNLYYMDFTNEITLMGALGENGLPLMGNVQSSFRSGLELNVTYTPHRMVTLTNNTTYSYNRIKNQVDGESATYTSPLLTPWLIVNQSVRFNGDRFYVGLDMVYNSESYLDFENKFTTPDFLLLNASVGYYIDKVTLKVDVRNLTNQNYYTNGYAAEGQRYFYVNAPISVFVGCNLNF
jgi:iron complex outermembrane receptor protein